jgi:methylated-DNA-[protein]-cysteine S-methyltransferase
VSAITFLDEETGIADINADLPTCISECISQLDEYFARKRKSFSFALNPEGTEFQKKVWKALLDVPFGHTGTYLKLAKQLGDANLIRAVGGANGKNPIAIVVPCHRIIGSNGNMIGYAGGLWRKEWLLNFERAEQQESLF